MAVPKAPSPNCGWAENLHKTLAGSSDGQRQQIHTNRFDEADSCDGNYKRYVCPASVDGVPSQFFNQAQVNGVFSCYDRVYNYLEGGGKMCGFAICNHTDIVTCTYN